MMKRTVLAAAALLASTLAANAADDAAAGRPGTKAKITRTIAIETTEYAFSKQALSFKAGETVKFVVTNKGKLKHELTIGTAEGQAAHRKAMEAMSDSGHGGHGGHGAHGGHGMDHEMPAGSIHVAPGETRELVWEFTTAGTLVFACNYPGHADLGMEGAITVN